MFFALLFLQWPENHSHTIHKSLKYVHEVSPILQANSNWNQPVSEALFFWILAVLMSVSLAQVKIGEKLSTCNSSPRVLNIPSSFSPMGPHSRPRTSPGSPAYRSPKGGLSPSSAWAGCSLSESDCPRGCDFRFRSIPERRFRDCSRERLRELNCAGMKIRCYHFQRQRSLSSNSLLLVG